MSDRRRVRTPGADPFIIRLAIPLYVLYELSVFVAMFAYRKRLKRQAKRDAEEAGRWRGCSGVRRRSSLTLPAIVDATRHRFATAPLPFVRTSLFAQVPTSPRAARHGSARGDTARRDSTAADSTKLKELIKWNEPIP